MLLTHYLHLLDRAIPANNLLFVEEEHCYHPHMSNWAHDYHEDLLGEKLRNRKQVLSILNTK